MKSERRNKIPFFCLVVVLGFTVAAVTLASFGKTHSQPATPDAGIAELSNQIHLGTAFFVNRTETKEGIRKHFEFMKKCGLTVVRIYLIWDDVERKPGVWTFDSYDWAYDAAAAVGIKIAATLFAEDPPGWMNRTPFYHNPANLNEPYLRERASIYIEKVVNRYKSHPAHAVWIVMNEPSQPENFERSTMEQFGAWLKAKYGSVEELNKHWFRPVRSFQEVQVSADQWKTGFCDYRSFIDWKEFNIDNLRNQLGWVENQVKKLDPAHPTHANPHGLAYNMPASGQDLWQERKMVDFLGASIHPAWHFGQARRDDFGLLYAYCVDLIRSASSDSLWWVTELQGGPSVYTGIRPLNPTKSEITRWLWDAIGAGAKGIVFWNWHWRTIGREAGEWGLVSQNGGLSERLEAVRRAADTIRREMPFLGNARAQHARAAILYNREAMLINALDGRPPAGPDRGLDVTSSLLGCYRALYGSHIPVEFLDIDGLKNGAAARYDVLYLPYSYAMDDQAVTAVRRYVENGGTVWADGLVAWKNEYGNVRSTIPGGLTDVFGCELEDIVPMSEAFSLTNANEKAGELLRLPLRLKGADVLLRTSDGAPVATRHRYGRGQAIYYATALSLGYNKRENPIVQRWIVAPAVEKASGLPVELRKGSQRIAFRGLENSFGLAAVLSNWGEDDNVTIGFRGDYQEVMEIISGTTVKTTRDDNFTLATLPVERDAVRVVVARGSKRAGEPRIYK